MSRSSDTSGKSVEVHRRIMSRRLASTQHESQNSDLQDPNENSKGSWKVLHHATNTRATVCKQQQSGSTEACNMKAEHVKTRTALLFVSACRKVTAVRLWLQAFGRKRSRSEQAAAVTKSPGWKLASRNSQQRGTAQ